MSVTYKGGCHCGAVTYEADLDIKEILSCNCSICSKRGSLLAFTPATNFRLLSGNDNLTDYQFGKKTIHHLFCKICGVGSFGEGKAPDGTEMRAINVRCLDGLDLEGIPIKTFDGKSL